MNPAQPARIDGFFDDHYPEIAAAFADCDPSGTARRPRAGSASEYPLEQRQPVVAGVVVGATAVTGIGVERAVAQR